MYKAVACATKLHYQSKSLTCSSIVPAELKQEFMIRKKAVQVGPARAFQVKDKSSVRHIIIIVVSPTGDKGAVLELPLSSFRTGAEVAVRKKWRTNVIVCQF